MHTDIKHNDVQSNFHTPTSPNLQRHSTSQLNVTYIAYMTVTNGYGKISKVELTYNHGVQCTRSVIDTHGNVSETPKLGPGDLLYIQTSVVYSDAGFSRRNGVWLVPGAVYGLRGRAEAVHGGREPIYRPS